MSLSPSPSRRINHTGIINTTRQGRVHPSIMMMNASGSTDAGEEARSREKSVLQFHQARETSRRTKPDTLGLGRQRF